MACAWTNMLKLHEVLDTYGIANAFEIYHGTHHQRRRSIGSRTHR